MRVPPQYRPRRYALIVVMTVAALVGALVAAPSAMAWTPTPTDTSNDVHALFDLINQERASYHLPAYRWSSKLNVAAHNHNIAMARANTLSHQVAGEPSLGARVSATGYNWSSLGENCAWGTDWTQAGIIAMHKHLFNETAPYDEHRRNILSNVFVDVGINVVADTTHHKFWLTEDFGRPM